jgi:polysaccharide export outer membrane protein
MHALLRRFLNWGQSRTTPTPTTPTPTTLTPTTLTPIALLALALAVPAHAQDPRYEQLRQQAIGSGVTGVPTITNVQPGMQPQPGAVPGRIQSPADAQRGLRPGEQLLQPEFPGQRLLPLPEPNAFQKLVAQSLGRMLPIFGQDLFREGPTAFGPVEGIPATADYVIGPGDELLIRAWGQVDIDYRAVVDRSGMISIPQVGAINVAGIRYQDLTGVVRTSIGRVFRGFELVVSLGQLRSIRVFVVGQAQRPGAYTVSSLSTLVNALFTAGGPSPYGSMRAIQLKRGARVVTEMDLYDLLLAGDKSKDAALLPGDVIYIPPVGPQVAVGGSVRNAAVFELKGNQTLAQLIELAGGLSTIAQTRRATLERIEDRDRRVVDQLTLDAQSLARPAKDGDLITVLAISPRFENAVTLRGNVAQALRHPWREGMRVRDLIPDKEALITRDYYLRKNLAVQLESEPGFGRDALGYPRGQRNGLTQRDPRDLDRRDARDLRDPRTGIGDQQRDPLGRDLGGIPQREMITQQRLLDEIRNLSEEINWDYAVIERLNEVDLSTSLVPFNLGKAVLENDPAQNLPLKAGDVVTVFSKRDVGAPVGRRSVAVHLEGEFNHSGVYQAKPGETLRQLIARAGGVTAQAYVFGAELTRDSTRKQQEERLARALDQIEREMQQASIRRAQSALTPEDAAALKSEQDAQRAAVARMRALKPTGRIVLELPEQAKLADLPDVTLEDGDRVLIPSTPSMVSVFGSVYNESSFVYRPAKSVDDYLAQAGGPRREADEKSTFVIRADGSVVSRRQSGLFLGSLGGLKPMPGDAIVVPEDFERTTWVRTLKDWSQIFYQFGLGAAAIQVLK